MILLTNDDGIYAPGLAAMEQALRRLGEVCVVAPTSEQSGTAHALTFQTPLMVREVYVQGRLWGHSVDGTPADCVKIALARICSQRPEIVVSGINGGFNAGINVLYSGTVAAAIEGSFSRITSFAVSAEYSETEPYERTAALAAEAIEHILARKDREPGLYNINVPLSALKEETPRMKIVSMDTNQYWDAYEQRNTPHGKAYYWLTGRPMPRPPVPGEEMTDLQALGQGFVTITPLDFDMTRRETMEELRFLEEFPLQGKSNSPTSSDPKIPPSIWTNWKK